MKTTVVGGGNTAFGLSASLKLRGFEVALLEAPEFETSIQPVIEQGGIRIRGVVGEGLAEIDMVTTEAKKALDGAAIVFVCVPAYGHQRMAELIIPHLVGGQVVLLMPGNCGGALEFAQLVKKSGTGQRPMVAEAASCLFACRKDGPAGVWVRGLKQGMPVAAFPARDTKQVVGVLKETFSQFEEAAHVLETSLNNSNHMLHPPGVLFNLGLVQLAKEDWGFFYQGLSPGVCQVMEAMDRERLEILGRLDLPKVTLLDWLLRFYGHQGMKGDTVFEAVSTSPVHGPSKGPRSIEHRYITEDVPFGLVPIASIGRELGVKTLAMDSVITLASIVSGRDWWAEGRTADKMGLAGMSARQMIQYVTEGTS
ncbi:MAG: NAD/NADP octopine/nopaline dehydrogenase family protein [Anaerolineae bacterium]